MAKYYKKAMDNVISSFEATHKKLLKTMEDGREPTPADLYKLDKYWQMQGQLKKELELLGNREIEALSKTFTNAYKDVYDNLAIQGGAMFAEVDKKAAEQVMQQIWCADGKTWSQRIWTNTDKLQQMLNDQLLDCVITGKQTKDLKNLLQEKFQVSYNAADSLVRTEIAHIQTQAAHDRYIDAGIQEVEVWADKDERRCDVCGKLHEKRFSITEKIPVPAHPRCRCTIIPVVEPDNQLVVREKYELTIPEQNRYLTIKENNDSIMVVKSDNAVEDMINLDWSVADFLNDDYRLKHEKHLKEYGDITFEEYVQGARELLSKPLEDNIDGFCDSSGALYKYDIVEQDMVIGSVTRDGKTFIITRFKPKLKFWKKRKEKIIGGN